MARGLTPSPTQIILGRKLSRDVIGEAAAEPRAEGLRGSEADNPSSKRN
jgi:hypothetical protein